jgi:hypothetical protein
MPIRFRDSKDECALFVEWVLHDVAARPPSGKRQTKPMQTMWMTRPTPKIVRSIPKARPSPTPTLRGSDITERRYVALKALTDAGASTKAAVLCVGAHLGVDTLDDLEAIRTGFYDFKAPVSINLWRGWFLDWADTVLPFADVNLRRIASDYAPMHGPGKGEWLLKFIERIRPSVVSFAPALPSR